MLAIKKKNTNWELIQGPALCVLGFNAIRKALSNPICKTRILNGIVPLKTLPSEMEEAGDNEEMPEFNSHEFQGQIP